MSKLTTFDHYVPLVPETNAKAKVFLQLDSDHVVFYVSAATKELRVRAYGSNQIYTLLQGVDHVHGFVEDGLAHVYVALVSGAIQMFTYRYFGEQARNVQSLLPGYSASYLHVVAQEHRYLMATEGGERFRLFGAKDPTFASGLSVQQIYSNLRDPLYRMAKPVIGIHPYDWKTSPDPSRVTIAMERTTRISGTKSVGFFVTEVVL